MDKDVEEQKKHTIVERVFLWLWLMYDIHSKHNIPTKKYRDCVMRYLVYIGCKVTSAKCKMHDCRIRRL